MRRVGNNVYTEIYFWGCNPGFVSTTDGVFMIDTPQQPINAIRWRETMTENHGQPRHLINTEPHIDHISGNAFFPGVEVIDQVGLKDRYEESIPMMTAPERIETMKTQDPDSVWLLNHPDFPPNVPTRTFTDGLTVNLGNHRIECIHMPGHTKPQTSVYLPDEGIVFTGDNIFHKCKTFIQEADPWEWLEALKSIDALDVEVIVPGHGEPCTKSYIPQQAQVIQDWIGAVQGFVDRGLSEDEAVKEPSPQTDPYTIGQRLFPMHDWVNERNVRNIYKQIMARRVGNASE